MQAPEQLCVDSSVCLGTYMCVSTHPHTQKSKEHAQKKKQPLLEQLWWDYSHPEAPVTWSVIEKEPSGVVLWAAQLSCR